MKYRVVAMTMTNVTVAETETNDIRLAVERFNDYVKTYSSFGQASDYAVVFIQDGKLETRVECKQYNDNNVFGYTKEEKDMMENLVDSFDAQEEYNIQEVHKRSKVHYLKGEVNGVEVEVKVEYIKDEDLFDVYMRTCECGPWLDMWGMPAHQPTGEVFDLDDIVEMAFIGIENEDWISYYEEEVQ